jgi:hypothetical protein
LCLWPGKLQRKAAEDALKLQLQQRNSERKFKHLAQDLCISGWLDKLNSNSDPKDPGTCLSHAARMFLKAHYHVTLLRVLVAQLRQCAA